MTRILSIVDEYRKFELGRRCHRADLLNSKSEQNAHDLMSQDVDKKRWRRDCWNAMPQREQIYADWQQRRFFDLNRTEGNNPLDKWPKREQRLTRKGVRILVPFSSRATRQRGQEWDRIRERVRERDEGIYKISVSSSATRERDREQDKIRLMDWLNCFIWQNAKRNWYVLPIWKCPWERRDEISILEERAHCFTYWLWVEPDFSIYSYMRGIIIYHCMRSFWDGPSILFNDCVYDAYGNISVRYF